MIKKTFALAVVGVALLAYYFASQEPPRTPEQVSALKAKTPVEAVADPATDGLKKPTADVLPAVRRPLAAAPAERHEQARIEVADEQALVDYNLKAIEQLRRIPEAAPLVDEIIEFLKSDHADEVSLNNIPADRNGLSVLDEHTMDRMVSNESIRAKWTKLMALVAEHPEALRPAENTE